MDATELIPGGFHFMKPETSDGVNEWTEWRERRTVKSLRYFFIDFGLSRQYSSNQGIRDVGILGQDQSYPERSATIPYDPFKTDIYQLGNVILDIVKQEYDGLEYFSKLGKAMTQRDPADRASISDMLAMVDCLKPKQLKRRVWAKRNPSKVILRIVNVKRFHKWVTRLRLPPNIIDGKLTQIVAQDLVRSGFTPAGDNITTTKIDLEVHDIVYFKVPFYYAKDVTT
ncbi:hypothetical protein C0993_007961 [Termitomyces sp. T159_Od127]|nr:hypothetical protein C0993_007961 [Termitomyces sp. T159_Od127]